MFELDTYFFYQWLITVMRISGEEWDEMGLSEKEDYYKDYCAWTDLDDYKENYL